MMKQPAIYRIDGGSPAWRTASDLVFFYGYKAIEKINNEIDLVEIKEVKYLLRQK